MADRRAVRDFPVSGDVWQAADSWAQRHGYKVVERGGDRRVYRKGMGFLTGFKMVSLSRAGEQAHLEAWVGALGLARAFSLFIVPSEITIESDGMKAAVPRKQGRSEVNDLLQTLGQPPID
jgi:hypothetical protein